MIPRRTGGHGQRSQRRLDRGAVTAEMVMALPLLIALTIGLAWLLSLGTTQVRLVDASREAARSIARGDDPGSAVAHAQRIAPPGSKISVVDRGETVSVRASARVEGPGGLFRMFPSVGLDADAVAVMEGEQ